MKIKLAAMAAVLAIMTACSSPVPAMNTDVSNNVSATAAAEASASEQATSQPTASAQETPTAQAINKPAELTQLANGDKGENVTLLQARLKELGYYLPDETTGEYDFNTEGAVYTFQRQAGLDIDGIAGTATQELIYSENAQKAVPFSDYAPTVNMEYAELVGDDGLRSYPEGFPKADTYKIIVDIANQVTMVYKKDDKGEYTVPVRYMLCSTGLEDRTPVGTFDMDSYHVRFSVFVRDGRCGQYWTQIRGAIYFHTTLYTKEDAATYIEETTAELGSKASHGCVRLCVPDARFMWYNIAPGTKCVIRNGSKSDVETAYIRSQLKLAQAPKEHMDLKAGEIPNTDNWKIEDVAHDVEFVQGSQN